MTLTHKVAFNTIFQIAGKIIVTAFSLIVVGYLTRYLGVAGYGIYTTIFAYVAFWAVLADFGFFWVLVRELSKPGSDQPKVFNNILTLKILFGLAVFFLCAVIGFFIPQYPWTIKIGIAIISASWFWMSLNSTYVGLFQSRLAMYKSVITEIVGRLAILIGVIVFIHYHYGLEAILWIYILGNFLNFFLSFVLGSFYIPYRLRFDFLIWKMILSESLPLAMISFIAVIHFRIDTIILSIFKGPVDVGIYGVPYKILEIIILVPGIFMGNVFPILTKYYHSKDKRLNISIQKSFDFLVFLALPVVAGLSILAWPIIKFIAGNEYLLASTINIANFSFPAPRILMILAFSVGISFLLTIFSNLLVIIGKQRKQVLPMATVTLINLVANLILIPRYSYLAAALVNLATGSLMFIWWAKLAHRYLAFKLNYWIFAKCFLATLVMGLSLYFLKDQNLFIAITIGALVYFIAAYFVKVFDKNMIMSLLPRSKR